jgi:hypothetical protein
VGAGCLRMAVGETWRPSVPYTRMKHIAALILLLAVWVAILYVLWVLSPA